MISFKLARDGVRVGFQGVAVKRLR